MAAIYNAILFFGAPGSGKGTQIGLLDKAKYFPVSTGEMFRNLDDSSELGKKIKGIMKKGNLVSDDLTVRLFYDTIEQHKDRDYFPDEQCLVLDGIPRTVSQVSLIKDKIYVKGVIYLRVGEEELIRRLLGRKRADDNEEAIKLRLKVYSEQTLPILGIYEKTPGLLKTVDGRGDVGKIHKDIELILKSL